VRPLASRDLRALVIRRWRRVGSARLGSVERGLGAMAFRGTAVNTSMYAASAASMPRTLPRKAIAPTPRRYAAGAGPLASRMAVLRVLALRGGVSGRDAAATAAHTDVVAAVPRRAIARTTALRVGSIARQRGTWTAAMRLTLSATRKSK